MIVFIGKLIENGVKKTYRITAVDSLDAWSQMVDEVGWDKHVSIIKA